MLIFEYVILGLTYTSLSIALFLQLICYTKKIESIASVAFTASLLLLVVSISLSPLFPFENATTISTLLCMVLVAVTTFLNTLSERKHAVPKAYIKAHTFIAAILAVSLFVAFWFDHLIYTYIQYMVVVFLIVSILVSMTLVRFTKPIKRYEHYENASRISALSFLVLVPAYLIFHYAFKEEYQQFRFGFLLYIGFTALALRIIYDDLQRLSLTNKRIEPQIQKFKNYGLTEREEEIAILLTKGVTYQNIATQLFISMPTVKTHASNIYRKCGVNTRNELTYLLTN